MNNRKVVITNLGVVAPTDIGKIEQLGLQYVDQRRSFAKLITTVKQTALRYSLRDSGSTVSNQ